MAEAAAFGDYSNLEPSDMDAIAAEIPFIAQDRQNRLARIA
jgi:hypothetical protein